MEEQRQQIAGHLAQLVEVRDRSTPGAALEAVLIAYAQSAYQSHGHHDPDLGALLHRDEHVTRARHRVRQLVRDLLAEDARNGKVRADVAPEELADYCLHALTAAGACRSRAALSRLVNLVVDALRPPR